MTHTRTHTLHNATQMCLSNYPVLLVALHQLFAKRFDIYLAHKFTISHVPGGMDIHSTHTNIYTKYPDHPITPTPTNLTTRIYTYSIFSILLFYSYIAISIPSSSDFPFNPLPPKSTQKLWYSMYMYN